MESVCRKLSRHCFYFRAGVADLHGPVASWWTLVVTGQKLTISSGPTWWTRHSMLQLCLLSCPALGGEGCSVLSSLPIGVAWFQDPTSVAWLIPPGKSDYLSATTRARVQYKIFRRTFLLPNNLESKHASFLISQFIFEACEYKSLGYFTKEGLCVINEYLPTWAAGNIWCFCTASIVLTLRHSTHYAKKWQSFFFCWLISTGNHFSEQCHQYWRVICGV